MPDKQPAIQIELLNRFFHLSGNHLIARVAVLITSGLFALTVASIPLIIGQFFTQILPGGNRQLLHFLPLVLAALLIIAIFTSWAIHYVIERLLNRTILDMRATLFRKLLTLPPAYSNLPVETISLYFFQTTEKLCHNFCLSIIYLSRDLLAVIGLTATMIWLNPEMSLLAVTVIAATFFIGQSFQLNMYQRNTLKQKQHDFSGILSKALQLGRGVHLDKGYAQKVRHIRNSFEQLQNLQLKHGAQTHMLMLLTFAFLTGIFTVFLYAFLQQLSLNLLTPGDAVAFFTAGAMIVFPLKRLSAINLLLRQCTEALQIIFPLLDRDSGTIEESSHITRLEQGKGKLRFEGVSYQETHKEPQLPSIDLEIASGQKIALINQDANINRLFADLVCGFVTPSTGRILLDDKDIKQLNTAELRQHIAWIAPDEDLLGDTIAANIAYGGSSCSNEIVITTAAHSSRAMEFIRKLPHGLQTKINKPDLELSDDQRQRILIARALLKRPCIVVLDETTACFNTENTALLQALQKLLDNRTILILSSRPVMLALAEKRFDPVNLSSIGLA